MFDRLRVRRNKRRAGCIIPLAKQARKLSCFWGGCGCALQSVVDGNFLVERGELRKPMTAQSNSDEIRGRILALDLGEKRVGVAVSDELQISISRVRALQRSNWKQLLREVAHLIGDFHAEALVIGFPLSLAGEQNSAAEQVKQMARNFARSLSIPVYLQDERLTSVAAAEQLHAQGLNPTEVKLEVDSQSAALILADFISSGQMRILVSDS